MATWRAAPWVLHVTENADAAPVRCSGWLWDFGDLAGWHQAAKVERQVFEEHRDILEGVVARGADPNVGSGLFYAVQNFDTSLAEWLLEHGADPNRQGPD